MRNIIYREVEKSLSERLGEPVKINEATETGGGCINNSQKIETSAGTFFLKWNKNCAADIFKREAESLEELYKAGNGSILVPKVICAKEVDDSPGFLLMEYLKPGNLSGSDEKLGTGLASIHKYYSSSGYGFYNNNYCGATLQDNSREDSWGVFFRERRLRFLLELIQKDRPFERAQIKIFDKLLNRVADLLPVHSKPSLIHGDLWSGNYLNTEKGPALIDPASYYADREMEFSIVTMFGGFSSNFFGAYNEVYPLEPDWQERNALYQLYHILNHYYLFGGGYGRQAVHVAQKYI